MVKDTLISLSNQKFRNFEHIVIDGGSNDFSLEVLNDYYKKGNIDRLVSEKDHGIFDAMNKGAKLARGDFLFYLNADDFLVDDSTLEKVYEFMLRDSFSHDIYYADLLMVDRENSGRIIRNWKHDGGEQERLVEGGQITQPSAFIRRSIFKDISFNTEYKIASDFDFFLRCHLKGCTFVHIPIYTTKMRVGGASNGNLNKSIEANRENLRSITKNGLKTPLLKYWTHRALERLKQLSSRYRT